MDNTIKDHLDGTEATSVAGLMNQSQEEITIIVEGDTDIRLFQKFTTKQVNLQKSVAGCKGVCKVLNEHPNESRIIGICDSDFTEFEFLGKKRDNLNGRLFYTDNHDMEMMIIPELWDELNNIYLKGPRNLQTKYKKKKNIELTEMKQLFEALVPLSCMRCINNYRELNLDFDCGVIEFFDEFKLRFDISKCLKRLHQSSKAKVAKSYKLSKIGKINKNETNIESLLKSLPCSIKMLNLYKNKISKFYSCFINGHDFLQFYAKYVRKFVETKSTNEDELLRSLQMAYNIKLFKKTNLYKSILKYSKDNKLTFWKTIS